MACEHEDFNTTAAIHRLVDTGSFYVDFKINCNQCGAPFHFLTPHYGVLRSEPAASPDATELRCPIAPGEGNILNALSSRFEMPAKKRES